MGGAQLIHGHPMMALEAGAGDHHNQGTQNDHHTHDNPQTGSRLIPLFAIERIAAMATILARTLLALLIQEARKPSEHLVRVDTQKTTVGDHKSAYEGFGGELFVKIALQRMNDPKADLGGRSNLLRSQPALLPFVSEKFAKG